ncbi:unnamed protein product [Brassica oleracea]
MVLNHHVLTRQKSFQDQDMAIMSSSIFITKGKFLKSPSPSSRFESKTKVHRISSKRGERAVNKVILNHKEPVVPIFQEIGNPLIDLDSFIFL